MAGLSACHHADASPTATVAASVAPNAMVVAIVDGDTVDVTIDGDGDRPTRVRLIGIDTPEIAHPGEPAECYGPEAALLTADLLPLGSAVQLQRDIEARDDYGRLLAYVFRPDGVFVNAEIVRRGYATPLRFEPNTTFAPELAAAARSAEAAGLGLWGSCSRTGADR